MGFAQRLKTAVKQAGNPVLVGIDPRTPMLPAGYRDRFEPGMAGQAAAFQAFSHEVIDVVASGKPIYRHVAEQLNGWAQPFRDETGYSLLGAVVGATYPAELAELRAAMPGVIFLVPGYGAQGGTAKDVAAAFDDEGFGAIVNNSRGIVFAYRQPELLAKHAGNWQRCIEDAVQTMAADLAAHTPAGRIQKSA